MRLVVIESPYAGDLVRNIQYAQDALRDCIKRGEAPIAGHLLYTQVLDDHVTADRAAGIACHCAWGAKADAVVVYGDYGISKGMEFGIARAKELGQLIEYRYLLPRMETP